MRGGIILVAVAAALMAVLGAARAHGSYDHDVIGVVVLEAAGAVGSAGDRLAVFANGTDGPDGGYVLCQRLLLGPTIIEVDCVTTFSISGAHVATFSGTAGTTRYSFQIEDQDLPDNTAEEIRIGVSTMPLNAEFCWASPNVSFTLTRSVAGSLEIL